MKPDSTAYQQFVADIKNRIRHAQYQALKKVNKELLSLYWDIGRSIKEKQETEGWGKYIVEKLSTDLQKEFPGIRGFSQANLWRMRSFYMTYHQAENLAPLVREIGWSHNVLIMEKCPEKNRQPLGIASHSMHSQLPKHWEKLLPTPEQISKNLKWIENEFNE